MTQRFQSADGYRSGRWRHDEEARGFQISHKGAHLSRAGVCINVVLVD
jgi:hypothetical protein